MKLRAVLFIILLAASGLVMAQAPNSINYQAALRGSTGQPMASQAVTLRFGIYSGAGASTKVYEETQALTTTAQGLVNCVIGNGTTTFGNISLIQWGNTEHHLKVEINSGSGFTDMGTQRLVSVPYALHSNTAGTANNISATVVIPVSQLSGSGATNGQVLQWNGTAWVPGTITGSAGGDITDVLAGTGLSGGGTSGSVSLSANTTSALWNANKLQSQDVSNTTPTNGQILKYTGGVWAPANESAITAGTGVSISGGVLNSVWTASGNNVFNNNTGFVGIGHNNPQYTLDVNGDTKISGSLGIGANPNTSYTVFSTQSAKDNIFWIENTSSSFGSAVNLKTNGGQFDNLFLGKNPSGLSTTLLDGTTLANAGMVITGTNAGKLITGTTGANAVHVLTASTTRMLIDATGNVGVNTLTPLAKLHVQNNNPSSFTPPGSAFPHRTAIYGFGDTSTAASVVSAGVTGFGKGGAVGAGLSAISGTTSIFNVGLYSQVLSTPVSGRNYGIYNDVSGGFSFTIGLYNDVKTTTNTGSGSYGIYSTVTGNGVADAFGGFFTTTAANAGFTNFGIYATATSGGTNYAGYFQGNTHINGTLSKSGGTFIIDHPQDPANKFLVHSFVESPDMMNIYNGNITTDASGFATVTLPAYFEAENMDFKYQLTVIGQFAQAIVKEKIAGNRFIIQTDKPNVEVSWQVTGVRNDAWANANRVVAEKEKTGADKGKYLHPELFGQPAENGLYVPNTNGVSVNQVLKK